METYFTLLILLSAQCNFTGLDGARFSFLSSMFWLCPEFVQCLYALKLSLHCNQEGEAARLNEEWCTLALKRLKEASPLALKVSLRSVSRKLYDASCLSLSC